MYVQMSRFNITHLIRPLQHTFLVHFDKTARHLTTPTILTHSHTTENAPKNTIQNLEKVYFKKIQQKNVNVCECVNFTIIIIMASFFLLILFSNRKMN